MKKLPTTGVLSDETKTSDFVKPRLCDGFNTKIMKNYKDVYTLPLEDSHGWIYDQNRNFVFQFLINDDSAEEKILNVINGKENLKRLDLVFKHETGQIIDNQNRPIILIRGWGNLTGIAAMNLPVEEASNIQDTFADFIVERLNCRDVSEAIA